MRASLGVLVAALLGSASACKTPETRINLIVPSIDGGCGAFADIACVNFLEFRARNSQTTSTNRCVKVDLELTNLCDVASLPDGRELFKLPPETPLPIEVQGKRVFPADSCGSSDCNKIVFRGTTTDIGRLGDYAGRQLDLTLTMVGSCGESEEFFFRPDGGTCAEICGTQTDVVCDGVQNGCLCKSHADGGQGGID
jgi:hypothetical protein